MKLFSAMLLDSYRQLNSKRMFWIVLALSMLLVVLYGSIGFNERGMSILFGVWTAEFGATEGTFLARETYRGIFSLFIVKVWLTWIATILALISTTSIFPDFIAAGSIDMVLSKPARRISLFVSKYLCSLLFVTLQVSIVCVGVFICMGLRIDDWNPRVFIAIPIVVFFFSTLYSFNVLVGVLTRSGMSALLLTMLLWAILGTLNKVDFLAASTQASAEQFVERFRSETDASDGTAPPQNGPPQEMIDMQESMIPFVKTMRNIIGGALVPFPKTTETIGLLDRWLVDSAEDAPPNQNPDRTPSDRYLMEGQADPDVLEQRMAELLRQRSPLFIIATSGAFELVMLSLACFVFVRRDY